MSFKQFPKNEGWIRAILELTKNEIFSKEDFTNFVSFGRPETIEVGTVKQNGKKVTSYYRQIESKPPTTRTNHGATIPL